MVDHNSRIPYSEQASFSIDREIGNGVTVSVGYLFTGAHKLARAMDLNISAPAGRLPDGKLLYVTTGAGRSVLIVDPAKKAVVGTIDGVGGFPRGIAISRDGKKLYTANGPSNDVAIIDVASKKVESRVSVPGAPWAIVLVP